MNRFKVYSGKDELLKVNDKYKKDNTYQPFSSYNSVNPGEEENPEEQNQNYYNYYNNYNNYSNQQQSGKSYADYVNQISEQGKLLPDLLVGDKKEEDKGNFFERAFATLKELPLDIQQGVFQWGSNIAKSVGSGGAKLGEWYGANINYDKFNKFLATDYATKLSQSKPISFINDPINTIAGKYDDESFYEQTLNQSYISDSPFAQTYIRGGAEQIGNMLPSIALSYVNPTLGKVSFGLSAAGGGIEEAIQSGATFDQALVYGVATGVLETAIEGISGGIGGVGEGLIGNILKETGDATIAKLTTNTLVKFAANTIGEGLEEVASELINPYLKRVTFDPDAPTASTQSVLQSFILGALCSAVLQGGNIALTSEVKQEFQKINELTEFQAAAYDKGRFADADAIGKMIESKTERLGEALQNNPEMQKIMKTSQSISKVSALNKVANRTDFSNYQETYTKLQDMISEDLKQMSKEDRQKFIQDNKVDYIFDKEGNINKDFSKLSTEQQSQAIRVVNKIHKLDSNVKVRFGSNLESDGYYTRNDNTITIDFDAEDPYRVVGLHEFTHSLEGSNSYNNLRDFIVQNLKKQNKYDSEFKKISSRYKEKFNETGKIVNLKSKLQKGEITQKEYYDQYNNMLRNYVEEEMVAKTISEDIFTDENTINELVGENESLGKRILKWINNKIKGTEPEFNAWRKELKTAKKLYKEAINEKKASVEEEKKLKTKVDSDKLQNYSEEEIKYSLKSTKNIPSDYVTGRAEAKQDKVYSKQEAQGIYEELIHSIATESGIAIDNDVETKVVNYIFQQLNTNKTTTAQIAEKVANYVFKNADISTDLPVDVKNDLMQEFKDYLATQVFYGGKESFRYKTQQDKLKMEARMKTMRETLKEKIAELKEKNKLYKKLYKESRTVAGKIAKLKEYSSRDYMDIAGAEKIADMLQKGVTIISNITDKNFYKAKTRKVVQDLRNKWYNDSNELIKVDENLVAEFDNILRNIDSKENLSLEEVKSLKRILSSMIKEIQEYDKVRVAGKEESISRLAQEGLYQTVFRPVSDKFFNSKIMKLTRRLVVKAGTYFKALEGTVLNEKGVLSKLLIEEKNRCEIKFYKNIMDLSDPFDKFFNKNKKFKNSLKQQKIKVGGVELNKAQAISVYMLSLRKQARGHFMSDVDKNAKGLEIYDEKGNYIANIILKQEDIDALYEKFDDTDKEYMAIVHEFFNKKARALKVETDVLLLGSTNILEENYYPIITDGKVTYKNLGDPRSKNLDSLFGLSFNEDVIEGANSEIKLMGVDTMVFSHLQKVARYNAYMEFIKTVRQVMNKKISTKESNNREVSLLGELDKKYPGFEKFLDKYLQDSVTSVKIKSDEDKFLAKVRKNFASYTLGLKISTVVNQFTIIPTAINVLSPKSVLKAATTKLGKGNAKLMDEYSVYARYRNYSGVVKTGEINVESKLNTLQDFASMPMAFGDKATTIYIWRACQIEAKSRYGYEYGTEENLKKAAELLEETMRKTQALDTSEQTELFRTDSEMVRTILLFQKQNIQTLSTITDYISQYRTIKQRLKIDNTEENRAKLKKINKNGAKAIAGLLASNLGYTLVASLFKYIKGTDDKDKELVPEFLSDFVGNTVGMIPIFNIIYDKLFEGYDMSLSVMDVFDDSADALMGMIDAIQTGNIREKWYKFVNAFGMATGIPTKNILNTVEVFIRPFNPDLAYKFRSMFYNKTVSEYTAVLEKSIQERDIKTTSSILEQIYTEKGIDLDSNVTSKLSTIISSYKVQNKSILIPKTANQTFMFDSTEYKLTDKEYRQFKKKYSENINKYLNSFMSNAKYATLKTEEKAQAIKYLQDYAYFKSIKQIKGVNTFEANKLTLLDKVINPVLAATVLAKCKGELKGNKAAIQKYINSLSVTREQKYLLYGMLGYKPLQGNSYVQVSNYLATKGYSIQEIHTILVKCKFIEDDEE